MLDADADVIVELKSMCSTSKQHCSVGGDPSAVAARSLHVGKASFNTKLICPNEFCSRL